MEDPEDRSMTTWIAMTPDEARAFRKYLIDEDAFVEKVMLAPFWEPLP